MQEAIRRGFIEVEKIGGLENEADCLTKGMEPKPFQERIHWLGIRHDESRLLSCFSDEEEEEYIAPEQEQDELFTLIDSSSSALTTWGAASQLFTPGSTQLMTVLRAIQVLKYLNDFTQAREVAALHAEGRSKPRTRRPTEEQCSRPCAACLEQCPEAQGDEELLGLLELVNRSGTHVHHGELFTQ